MQIHVEPRAQALAAIANYAAVRARLWGCKAHVRSIPAPVEELPPAAPVWPWAGPLEEVDWEAERRDLIREIYKSPIGPPAKAFERAHFIARVIMQKTSLTFDQLKSCRRDQEIVRPRTYGMWMLDRYTTWSLGQIGKFFGDKNHTTVLHAVRKYQALFDAGLADETGYLVDRVSVEAHP